MIPAWLEPVREGARTITVAQLTRFEVPPGEDARPCAVLVLFADGDAGPEVVLTERAHHMRSHPGQVSFAGGALEAGETVEQAALREAWEEIGLDPASVETFGRLPELWMPPSNAAVTPVLGYAPADPDVGVRSPDEVHAVHRESVAGLLDPANRYTVRHPSGFIGPAFRIGPDRDVVLWGFTGGILSRLFDHVGWTRPWDADVVEDVPTHMLTDRLPATEPSGDLPDGPPPAPSSAPSSDSSAAPSADSSAAPSADRGTIGPTSADPAGGRAEAEEAR